MLWPVTTAANVAISIAYSCIAWIIYSGLRATQQLGSRPRPPRTCSAVRCNRGSHAVPMILPGLGVDDPKAPALRDAWPWQTAAWDIFGAALTVYHLSLRGLDASVLLRRRQAAGVNPSGGA